MTLGGASLPVAAQPILRESRAFSLLPEWPGALIGSSPIRRPAGPMHLVVAGLPFQLGDPQPHAAALPAAAAWDGALPFYLPGNSGGGPGPRRKPLPYFGLGWTVHLGHNRHLVFNDDAGLMFEGRPGFVGSGRYGPTPLPDTTVQRMEAAAASGRLRWQPVVTASLAYRF